MYFPLVLSLSLLPALGLAAPTTDNNNNKPALFPRIHLDDKRDSSSYSTSILNTTKTFVTSNGFPDPEVHCSGRTLVDASSDGDSYDYQTDLEAAVAGTSDESLYGACNVDGADVDGGDGSLAWKSGYVQVYFCNHGFAATTCDINEYWRADALIKAECGNDGGGWVSISDWDLTVRGVFFYFYFFFAFAFWEGFSVDRPSVGLTKT